MQSSFVAVHAQSSTATLSGTVMDQAGAVIPDVNIAVISVAQGFQRSTTTGSDGVFVVPSLPPGNYIVKAEHEGFSPAEQRNVILNVNSQVAIRMYLKVGNISQTIEIVDASNLIDLMPSVNTLVDQQFVNNLPLNGRSFQPLLFLTPGVVPTKANSAESGQLSVNGQRANANYFLIDGVSANIGAPVTQFPGQLGSGSLPGLTASGGTNNLVSIDALQEFKVLTSTFAPEFGRTPGAQISIATRSGTNEFHGSLFDYFRNEALDANDWFSNAGGFRKAALRQNDFGGVFGGPILLPRFGEGGRQPGYNGRNRSFFFFSYEGLRLRLPQTASTLVPSLAARQSAAPDIKPFVEAFSLPNGPDLGTGLAGFSATYSDPSTLNATSIRIDHTANQKLSFFGRYNYAPSETVTRGGRGLSSVNSRRMKTQTLTMGTTFFLGQNINNDLRVNFSRNEGKSFDRLDDFGGAKVPADSVFFPQGLSTENARFTLTVTPGTATSFTLGQGATTIQRQFNIVNGLSILAGNHQFKFGGDYRRIFPIVNNLAYQEILNFNGVGVPSSPASSSVLSGKIRSG
ncbi:MAG TPA: carboxypeptidase-like regulatory domain-containing protein, partial [Pyrinomonadaceae bacterium]|nr:carboxypeptidase-like regulatory domain-containing protein [Pyrinomonadaceae bacterium]